MELINILKALSDETRLRMLYLLRQGDLCVCELEVLLDINQSNASRHLNKLNTAGITEYYKVSKYVYYRLSETTLEKYSFIDQIFTGDISEKSIFEKDMERLSKYQESGMSCDDLKGDMLCFDCLFIK